MQQGWGRQVVAWSLVAMAGSVGAQPAARETEAVLYRPARLFLGAEDSVRTGWVLLTRGDRIAAVGPAASVPSPNGARVVDLPDHTLLPGLIEGHAHFFLHPYNETAWNDQVLKEPLSLRTARAVNHLAATLRAGVTTARDLGTEGAGDADAGLKRAVQEGIIPGPRLLIAGRALIATGSYAPRRVDHAFVPPQGAAEADGVEGVTREVRRQIGEGADVIKVYADYRWGPAGEAQPTFSEDELRAMAQTAASSGRPLIAHAATAEGMLRAVRAGVRTIEHGDGGTAEVWALMRERGVALCPTLAATESTSRYRGWQKGVNPVAFAVLRKQLMLREARAAGVAICFGGDVGVYPHGENALELELLVEYGMRPAEALFAATAGNARYLGLPDRGALEVGRLADLVAVRGDPTREIARMREVGLVVLGGRVVVR